MRRLPWIEPRAARPAPSPWAPQAFRPLAFLLLLALAAVGAPAQAAPAGDGVAASRAAPPAGGWNLTIFHTNDMHGSFLPEPASWREDRAEVGGMIALAWHLQRQRRSAPASLLLDAGDFMTGNPISDLVVDGVAGGALVDMMAAVGYEASVVGNHELDKGLQNARALAARAPFPLLASDLLDESGRFPFAHEPVVVERGGIRVGIMGVTCATLFEVLGHGLGAGLSLRDQELVVREQIADLDPRTDLLVLITHNGLDGDVELARRLAGSGLDVIVGGHSHTRLETPRVEAGIVIVQAGSHLKHLGRLDLRVAGDRVEAHRGTLVELTSAGATADERLEGLVGAWRDRVDTIYGEVIGRLATPWQRRHDGESNIGNWLADRLRERAGAAVGFLNSGSIRKDLPAGPITLMDVHEILPFANEIVVVQLTGRELLGVLRQNARAAGGEHRGVLQVSGLSYAWRGAGDRAEVGEVAVGGRPLDPEAVYSVAVPDYVARKADQYLGLKSVAYEGTGAGVTETVVAAIRAAGEVDSRLEGRIRRQGP